MANNFKKIKEHSVPPPAGAWLKIKQQLDVKMQTDAGKPQWVQHIIDAEIAPAPELKQQTFNRYDKASAGVKIPDQEAYPVLPENESADIHLMLPSLRSGKIIRRQRYNVLAASIILFILVGTLVGQLFKSAPSVQLAETIPITQGTAVEIADNKLTTDGVKKGLNPISFNNSFEENNYEFDYGAEDVTELVDPIENKALLRRQQVIEATSASPSEDLAISENKITAPDIEDNMQARILPARTYLKHKAAADKITAMKIVFTSKDSKYYEAYRVQKMLQYWGIQQKILESKDPDFNIYDPFMITWFFSSNMPVNTPPN